MTRRWVIVLTAEDGATSAYGSWRDADTAEHLAGKLREVSGHYGGPGADVQVSLEWVERWPGLKRAIAELTGD